MNKVFLLFISVLLFLSGCTDKVQNSSNTFYVEYTCKDSSLLQTLNNATSGKVSYYDNKRELQIVSLNYVTEEHPKTHYFKVAGELPAKPEINTIKYLISFNDSQVNDSIAYSLQKYFYAENKWQKKSDMGMIKVFTYLNPLDKNLKIVDKSVASRVLQTIVADTYNK